MATTHAQIASWADEYQTLKNEIVRLRDREVKLRDLLLSTVPANTELSAEGRRVLHTLYEQRSLNTAMLRQEAPDVYERFSEVKAVTRLTVR